MIKVIDSTVGVLHGCNSIPLQFFFFFFNKAGRQNCRTGKLKIPTSKQIGIFAMFLQSSYKELFYGPCKTKLATKIVFVSSVVGESDLKIKMHGFAFCQEIKFFSFVVP